MLVGDARILVRRAYARADAELDELALEDLATDLVAKVLLAEATATHLAHDVRRRHRATLLLLGLRGDVGDAAVDLLRRHRDVRLVGLLFFQTIVDHPVEQLLVHLLLLHADHVRIVRLRADLHARRRGAVQELGPQQGALADDRHHALDDGRAGGGRREGERGRHGDERKDEANESGEPHRRNV